MAQLHVEKLGGLAGFGGIGGHIRSHGHLDSSGISIAEQRSLEELFHSHSKGKDPPVCDGFRYRITRTTTAGAETIEVPEKLVPAALVQCVKDELV